MGNYQSQRAEFWCALTHGIGIVGGLIIASYFVLQFDRLENKVQWALAIYCLSFIFLYSASTLYHSVVSIHRKKTLQKFDHIGIYLLIAGTYTPICVILLWDSHGRLLLTLVWLIAGFGSLLKLKYAGRFEKLSLFLYIAMGWLILIDIRYFLEMASTSTIVYLVLGGLAYSIGTIFYRWHGLSAHHIIWHVFVLIGSFFHFLMIEQSLNAV